MYNDYGFCGRERRTNKDNDEKHFEDEQHHRLLKPRSDVLIGKSQGQLYNYVTYYETSSYVQVNFRLISIYCPKHAHFLIDDIILNTMDGFF